MEHDRSGNAPSLGPEAVIGGASQVGERFQTRTDGHQDDRTGALYDEATKIKAGAIAVACDKHDLAAVTEHATSAGGLLTDALRQQVWPMLLGCRSAKAAPEDKAEPYGAGRAPCPWRDLPEHKDEDQVRLDVNRSFVYYPRNASETDLAVYKVHLSDVIVETLRRYPMLSYFQGFHDIVQVLLLVLGVDVAADAVAHLSLLRIRDFMLPSLSPSLDHLQLLPAILYSVDRQLYAHVSGTKPFFALAATLTLYAHEIQEYGDIARLFDFLLAQEAAVAVYFFAVIILSRKKELLDIPDDEPEMLHVTLSKLPQPLNLEALIQRTVQLFDKVPPEALPFRAWRKVPRDSVLKTTRDLKASTYDQDLSSLEDGVTCFNRQVVQLRRREFQQHIMAKAWKHRRTIGGVGFTILVAAFSIWLQRRPNQGLYPVVDWLRRRRSFCGGPA